MSSYPPPPPPPPGGPNQPNYTQYPPNSTAYNRAVWKAQRRAAKQQERFTRQQIKLQRRMMRPRSIVGPLVILALGVLFLLAQTGHVVWPTMVEWYARWWPLVLLTAGVVLLAEWALDQQAYANGRPYRGRTLGGGVVFLLFMLTLFGVSAREAYRHFHWGNDHVWGFSFPDMDTALGEEHDFDDSVTSSIASGTALLIRNPHGDVTVTGTSDDDQVHVTVHKEVHARSDDAAAAKENALQPKFSNTGGVLTVEVAVQDGSQADLTLQLPRTTVVTVNADHGDVDVEQMHANITISANRGSVTLTGITGDVNTHMNSEHADFSAHSMTGAVNVDGHLGDATISDVTGTVSVDGDLFGNTHVEHVSSAVQFKSSRTQLQLARLDGDMDLDGENLNADQLLGPVVITTKYGKDMTLSRVQGSVTINNGGKGSVSLTNTSPLGAVSITNSKGSVDVGVPANAGFDLTAQTRNGDMENDFGLKSSGSDDRPILSGKVGAGGPQMSIFTTDGDVTVRKSTVAPLPPIPPAPPKLMPPPPPPAQPAKPSKSAKPAIPAKPAVPAKPVGLTDF